MPVVMHVVPTGDGWTVTDETMTEDESRVYPSGEQAVAEARLLLEEQGGGELVVHGADGQVRNKEIVGIVDTGTLPG